jgi:hypothetical protein
MRGKGLISHRKGSFLQYAFSITVIAAVYLFQLVNPCIVSAAAEWTFTPSMTVAGVFDDNYFRSQTNKTSVWTTQYAPGIALQGLTDRSRLDLNYTLGYFENFGQRGKTDMSSQDYLGHDLSLFAATKVYERFMTGIEETFIQTREPGSTDNVSNITVRDEYWRNRVSPFIKYDIGEKGELKAAYRMEQLTWQDAPNRPNSNENRGALTGTYNLNSTNHIDLDEQIWRREYTYSKASGYVSDYDSYQTSLIYRRDLSSWLTARASVGYQYRTFDNNALPAINCPTFLIGVAGATDKTKLGLSFEHNLVDFTLSNSYFDAYRLNAFAQRLFFEDRFRAYLGGYYQLSDYYDSTRADNTYNIYAGLGYSFYNKIFEISIEYQFTNDTSNMSTFNYSDNMIFLRLTAKYDIPRKNQEATPTESPGTGFRGGNLR